MNTVLVQEAIRYNGLLKIIKTSLNELLRALKGLVVMSQGLERMATSLFNSKVGSVGEMGEGLSFVASFMGHCSSRMIEVIWRFSISLV